LAILAMLWLANAVLNRVFFAERNARDPRVTGITFGCEGTAIRWVRIDGELWYTGGPLACVPMFVRVEVSRLESEIGLVVFERCRRGDDPPIDGSVQWPRFSAAVPVQWSQPAPTKAKYVGPASVPYIPNFRLDPSCDDRMVWPPTEALDPGVEHR
jgi:hypothetical protein